jgi:hypothetical protein
MRPFLPLAALLCAALLPAVEQPLTLMAGTRAVVIDPAFGDIQTYEVQPNTLKRLAISATANFVADLTEFGRRWESEDQNSLRLGSLTCKPSYADIFEEIRKAGGKKEDAKALYENARKSEDAFWKTEPKFDGRIATAISSDGSYLFLAVPALHVVMVYELRNDRATLHSLRNWGAELYIPSGWKSTPDLNAMLKELSAENRQAVMRQLDAQADGPRAVLAAEQAKPTSVGEVWLAGGPRNSVLVVDLANRMAMLYQVTGKDAFELRSVRDLSIDLLIPQVTGIPANTQPFGQEMIKAFAQARAQQLAALGIELDRDYLNAFANQRQGGVKTRSNPLEASIEPGERNLVLLNFTDRRVALTFNLKNGQSIDRVAIRDTVVDLGLSAIEQLIQDRERAKEPFARAKAQATKPSQQKVALMNLKSAFSYDPTLYKEAEKLLAKEFRVGAFAADFQALIDQAAKDAERLAKEAEERKRMVEEMRKAREEEKKAKAGK